MKNIPLSLQLYSLRDDCAKDLPGTLKAVAEIGYEAVEFAGYYNYSATDLKKMLDDLNLRCAGTHTGLGTVSDDELKATAEFNAILGNPYLIVPGVGAEYQGTREGAMRLAEKLAQAGKTAAEFGAFVGYHNHSWEFKPLPNGEIAMEILAINTPREVVLQVDTGNAQDGGGNPVEFLERWGHRATTVHLKPSTPDFARYYLGEDDTDWAAVLNTIKEETTKFIIVEQERYPEPNTPLDCVKRCYDNLKKLV